MIKGTDYLISVALTDFSSKYSMKIDEDSKKLIREHTKYNLYKYYGEKKEKPNTKLTEREKDVVNIITNVIIEMQEKQEENK